MPLFFLILAVLPQTNTGDLLWNGILREIREDVSEQDWIPAKAALDRLSDMDSARFNRDRLFLTRAFIAEQEDKWETVLDCYLQSRDGVPEVQNLAMAEAWARLGKDEKALTSLHGMKFNELQDREQQERARFLLAEKYFELKNYVDSERNFRWLVRHGRMNQYLLPANLYLVKIQHIRGRKASARRIAEHLQTKWPGSDEALESVYIQLRTEKKNYLDRFALRMGMVGYRNRDYDLSTRCFKRVMEYKSSPSRNKAKARYLRALTFLKEEHPAEAFRAFEDNLPLLSGTRYGGLAVFQAARSLFLLGRDREVIQWVETRTPRIEPVKWRWETEKLRILALRRNARIEELEQLWSYYDQEKAPYWLMAFYHRHSMAQSLLAGKPQKARRHLSAISRRGQDMHQKLELKFWKGLIAKEVHEDQDAEKIWMALWRKHPNHFFGIAARHMLHSVPASPVLELIPVPDSNIDFMLNDDPPTESYARIGRFDWAARTLNRKDQHLSQWQFLVLKAKYFEAAGLHHEAIKLTPAILSFFPKNTPMDVLPVFLQKLIYPLGFERQVLREADVAKVDPLLLQAIMREETHFNANAKSSASARGVMQFIPETARRMSTKRFPDNDFNLLELYDPDYSISLGATFVSQLQESFGYIPLYSIAAYNAGEGAVEKWKSLSSLSDVYPGPKARSGFDPLLFIFDVTYRETKRYCQKVMASYYQYRRIYQDQDQYPLAFSSRMGHG